jgi:lipoprotein-releasing system ATP-binding protein
MLQARGIKKSYGNLQILKGVDLDVKRGEIITIIGASGAGKSTLLHVIGTLDQPDHGTVRLNNVDVHTLSSKKMSAFRNEQIGFIFQFHHLLPEFTALENICIPAFIAGKSKKDAENKAFELLELLGLSDRANHKPNEMSGGEQQRVAVARAMVNDPAIIDSNNAENLHHLFVKLRDTLNQTFVIVTHNENLANLADRKVLMKDGQIINY